MRKRSGCWVVPERVDARRQRSLSLGCDALHAPCLRDQCPILASRELASIQTSNPNAKARLDGNLLFFLAESLLL